MKRLWIGVLAFALVLGSVFFLNMNGKDAKAAEEASGMLNVKFQIATDDTDAIRFVASVDSLEYKNAGFEVTYDGLATPKSYETTTVYERIHSEESGVKYEFSPKVVDMTSKYFVTAKLHATEGVDYKVKAFVTTKAGVKIYGAERCVSLGDDANNTINMMVGFTTTDGSTYDVYEGETKVGTAAVVEDKNVRITLTGKQVDTYPSATEFTFKNDSTEVGTAIYRNYYTTYAEDGADTTWYDVDADASTFVIASSADMWGLANVVNTKGDVLANQTVVLIRDVAVTDGSLQVANDGSVSSDYTFSGTTLDWIGIGQDVSGVQRRFQGTFDGDGNTVSGIYTKTETNAGVGLFGRVAAGSIKNLRIANSYIAGEYMVGPVAGLFNGDADNIYVEDDVVVKMAGSSGGGGIVGQFDTNVQRTIVDCWFDGTLLAASPRVGGIIGRIYKAGNLTVENCLNTGMIISTDTSTTPRVGGIIGSVTDDQSVGITIRNCVNTGEIVSTKNTTVGTVIGQLDAANNKITIQDVYTIATDAFDTTNGGDGFGSSSLGKATVNGKPVIFDTVASLQGEAGYVNTDLDFENTWVATANGPELKAFSEETPVDLSTVTTIRSNQGWYCNALSNETKGSLALPNNPSYELNSESDFYAFAVMAGTDADYRFENATVNLVTDIDMNPGWNASTKEAAPVAWPGIGTTASLNFNGTFNGNGHTISGIYSNDSALSSGYEALFGYTGNNSTVQNFRLENSYFTSTSGNLGAVVGVTKGSIKDIYVADSVLVEGSGQPIGGIAGIHSGSTSYPTVISNCQFDGTVIGSNSRCGGFVGRFYTGKLTMENCLFTGTARGTAASTKVGGFVADVNQSNDSQSLTIQNCLSNGTVESAGTSNVGAVIGATTGVVDIENTYAVDNKVYIGTTEGGTIAAGKYGIGSVSGTVTGAPALVTIAEITGNNAYIYTGLDLTGDIWQVAANGTPELVAFTDATPIASFTGTKVDTQWYCDNWKNSGTLTYTIDTANELLGLERVADTYKDNFQGHTVQLGADIKLNGDWVPEIDANGNLTNEPSNEVKIEPIGDVTAFKGTFDGQGHTISGVYMTRTANYASLFARIEATATLKNFAEKDSYIKQTGNLNWAGSVLGFSYGGTVSNVYSNAIVVSDGVQMGGLIARAEGTVSGCWFDGTMMCTRASWIEKAGVGGVVGTTVKGKAAYPLTIINCLNTGEVIWNVDTTEILGIGGIFGCTRGATPTVTISNCINAGTITTTGTNGIGAIMGMVNESATLYTIENCYTTNESGVTEILGNDTASAEGSAIVTSYALAASAITGATLYSNEDISLDFDVWTARSNDVPTLAYFVGKVVAEADTVAKEAE